MPPQCEQTIGARGVVRTASRIKGALCVLCNAQIKHKGHIAQ